MKENPLHRKKGMSSSSPRLDTEIEMHDHSRQKGKGKFVLLLILYKNKLLTIYIDLKGDDCI